MIKPVKDLSILALGLNSKFQHSQPDTANLHFVDTTTLHFELNTLNLI